MQNDDEDMNDPATYGARNYQDELDTADDKTDPIMNEAGDDPVETLGVPANELRAELDKRDLEDPDTTDDMRQEIEDLDDGQGERD